MAYNNTYYSTKPLGLTPKVGDQVRTPDGYHGEVVAIDSDEAWVRINGRYQDHATYKLENLTTVIPPDKITFITTYPERGALDAVGGGYSTPERARNGAQKTAGHVEIVEINHTKKTAKWL